MTFKKKLTYTLAVLALAVAGSANAKIINLGTITAPENETFYRVFEHADEYTDRIDFVLTSAASLTGSVLDADELWSGMDTDIEWVSLYRGSSLLGTDTSASSFSIASLAAGAYSLFVRSDVDGHWGDGRFRASLSFAAAPTTSVPEPGTLALAGMGLLALGFAMRRRLFN
jgi:hypothetical protein